MKKIKEILDNMIQEISELKKEIEEEIGLPVEVLNNSNNKQDSKNKSKDLHNISHQKEKKIQSIPDTYVEYDNLDGAPKIDF